jgi:hypothetical protein
MDSLVKEIERRLNEILRQTSSGGIRRRKMEKRSSENINPETRKVRFDSNTCKTERVSLAGDLNGCVLVIPEVSGVNDQNTLYQEPLPEYHF